MFQVSTSFECMDVAIKATELLSVAFPMLTFELCEIPELEFDSKITPEEWLNFVTNYPSCSGKSFNEILNEEFKECPTVKQKNI